MSDDAFDRIPPNSLDAERSLLGALMIRSDLFDTVSEIVEAGDFYAPMHETLFASIAGLCGRREPVDKVSVAEELRSRGMLDHIGGIAYLSTIMAETVATTASVEYYAKIVREKSALRGLIHAGAAIERIGYESEFNATTAMSQAEELVAKVTQRGSQIVAIRQAGVVAQQVIDRIQSGVVQANIRPPWTGLHERTGGFMAGELCAIVAAPKIGKSGIVLGFGDYFSMHYGQTVLFVPENGVERTTMRLLGMYTGIPARRQRIGRLDREKGELSQLIEAQRRIATRPLFMFGREVKSLSAMWRTLRKVAAGGPITAVIVDHVGVLEDVTAERRGSSEHQRLDRTYQTLIEMAHTFACPIFTVQHLNREGYKPDRDGNIPEPTIATMAHIRGGGNLEGHADHIIFPHRPKMLGTAEERQIGKLIVAFSRDGEGGYVDMRYIGYRTLWVERDVTTGESAVPWFEHNRAPRGARTVTQPQLVAAAASRPYYEAEDLGDPADVFGR